MSFVPPNNNSSNNTPPSTGGSTVSPGSVASETNYADPAQAYASQKQLYLSFYHIASKKSVKFKAFVTNYNESFRSNWNYEPVFGRMDPIATFKNTERNLTVAWKIPAASLNEARENLANANLLAQFMYPAYNGEEGRADVLSRPPLMRIRFANLIRNAAGGNSPNAGVGKSGLLSAVNSLSVNPDFGSDSGFFDKGTATLFPKNIEISIEFVALHEHSMGWGAPGSSTRFNSDRLANNYPYGGVQDFYATPSEGAASLGSTAASLPIGVTDPNAPQRTLAEQEANNQALAEEGQADALDTQLDWGSSGPGSSAPPPGYSDTPAEGSLGNRLMDAANQPAPGYGSNIG
jgi:hypothetical protein